VKKTERNCGNCQYWDGLNATVAIGGCTAPIPASVRFSALANYRRMMYATGGTECPSHRMKTVRKVATAATKPA